MVIVDISEVKTGDVIAAPVRINDIEIVRSGTVASMSLISVLKNLGVKSVWIASLDIEFKKLSKINPRKTKTYNNLAKFAKSYSSRITGFEDVTRDFDNNLLSHSVNVSIITNMIISEFRLPLFRRKNIITGALLHDVGKLRINPLILNKPGKLTAEEYEVIKQHPIHSFEMGGELRLPNVAKTVMFQHHENFDGSGYPLGLKGDDIHIGSMAVHIADVYEARCSKRIYKDANARFEIKEDMKHDIGTMFDKRVFEAFDKNVPLYFKGEEVSIDGEHYLVVGYDDNRNPVFQSKNSGDIFTHNELMSNVKEVLVVNSIHIGIE